MTNFGAHMKVKPKTIEAYLATLTEPRRATLAKLRQTIHELVPEVDECISYGLPAFRVGTKIIAGFSATAKGCSYYPFSGSTLPALAKDVAAYSQTRGALHFAANKPLPVTLVRKLLKARLAEAKR
jgi:uncharacterized protein YdhG (YjbR/CyaY superfamily)